MQTAKTMPWWVTMLAGLLILTAGIFLIAWKGAALDVLTFLLGAGVLGFGLYNVFMAVGTRDDNRLCIPFIAHGIFNFIMFILVLFIYRSPAHLGVILGSWLIIFGVFRIIYARQDAEQKLSPKAGVFTFLIGAALIIIPFAIGIDHVLFIGIVAVIVGTVRAAMGIIKKTQVENERTSLR